MKKLILLTTWVISAGCASTVATPPPTDIFTATANYRNEVGSQELAMNEAKRFCKHWKAVPGIIKSETIDTLNNPSQLEASIEAERHHIQTTLTYKCY